LAFTGIDGLRQCEQGASAYRRNGSAEGVYTGNIAGNVASEVAGSDRCVHDEVLSHINAMGVENKSKDADQPKHQRCPY
jgi:hypothetical protein